MHSRGCDRPLRAGAVNIFHCFIIIYYFLEVRVMSKVKKKVRKEIQHTILPVFFTVGCEPERIKRYASRVS